jgi:uncharacterized membrane protein
MDTSPRADSVWFIVAMVAAALGGVIAIAAIAAPADTTETATAARTMASPR